jgi:hypothetical protein
VSVSPETRLRKPEEMTPIAVSRDSDPTLDNFDFTFNPKMNCSLVFDATGRFIGNTNVIGLFRLWRRSAGT